MGRPSIPGPLIEADVGDTVVINFRNECGMPVTMHPHGIFYTVDMDGTYKGKYTDPGGFVENGHTFRYVWEARQDTVGAWLYHDHGPMDPIPVFKGLFGSLIVRDPAVPRPDREFFICFHSFTPPYISLDTEFMCINGRAYAGNTPTLRAKTGESVTWHVYALDNNFHTFHLHGHRWLDTDGGYLIDTKTLGPADIITLNYTEDNPGPLVLPLPRVLPPAHGDERLVFGNGVSGRRGRAASPARRPLRSVAAAALAAARMLAVAFAGSARAADARVAIGHYRWSTPVVHVDLGQHVTWYWVGPDTMHSVTGDSPNDLGIDSDPGNPEPMHKVGFTFTVVFTQPGVYLFHCKLHNIVHGEVIVSDTPGNPNDDPDPIPKPNVNLTRPSISSIHLSPNRFGTRGTTLDYALDDRSSIDAEIWHLSDGHRGSLRRLAGTARPHRPQLRTVRPAGPPLQARAGTLRRVPDADRHLPQRRAHPAAGLHDPQGRRAQPDRGRARPARR